MHAVAQLPQWSALVARSTQTPLHIVWPFGHAHLLLMHVEPPLQAIPQPPQFWLSLVVSTQAPPQLVRPLAHWSTHMPREQNWFAAPPEPHAPQMLGSVCVVEQTHP